MGKQDQELMALLICGVQAAEYRSKLGSLESIRRHGYLRESA